MPIEISNDIAVESGGDDPSGGEGQGGGAEGGQGWGENAEEVKMIFMTIWIKMKDC